MTINDKIDRVKQLMDVGKERGYVLYDEVSDVLPADLNGGGELDDVLAGFLELEAATRDQEAGHVEGA